MNNVLIKNKDGYLEIKLSDKILSEKLKDSLFSLKIDSNINLEDKHIFKALIKVIFKKKKMV